MHTRVGLTAQIGAPEGVVPPSLRRASAVISGVLALGVDEGALGLGDLILIR